MSIIGGFEKESDYDLSSYLASQLNTEKPFVLKRRLRLA